MNIENQTPEFKTNPTPGKNNSVSEIAKTLGILCIVFGVIIGGCIMFNGTIVPGLLTIVASVITGVHFLAMGEIIRLLANLMKG